MFGRAATIKRLEYLPLGSELRKQIDMIGKQYGVLRMFMNLIKRKKTEMNKEEEDDETSKINKYNKSDLFWDGNHNFYKYYDIKRFNSIPFKSKYSFLFEFYYDLETFGCLYLLKEQKKTPKKMNVYDAASKLYNELLEFYLDEYYDFPNARKSRMDRKCGPINLLLDVYDYRRWFKKRRLRIS